MPDKNSFRIERKAENGWRLFLTGRLAQSIRMGSVDWQLEFGRTHEEEIGGQDYPPTLARGNSSGSQ